MANKIIIVGNLGNDPEIKYLDNGNAVCRLSVATTERWKDKSGERKEETQWHRVVIFGKLAEVAAEYLRKGSKVYLEGAMRYGKYEKDGVTHYSADVTLGMNGKMEMLDPRPQDDGGAGHREVPGHTRPPARPARQATTAKPEQGGLADDFADDDIPFN